MGIYMTEQGTIEWKQQRLGHVTASKVADIMAKGKSGEAKSRENYRFQLARERLYQKIEEGFTNDAMAWGTATEPLARIAYEVSHETFVDQTGFVKHKSIPWVGCSPDGLVDENGLIEIKCPNSDTHLRTLCSRNIPTQYFWQMQMQMWVMEREWCDFVSFDPRAEKSLQLFVKRLPIDLEAVADMEKEIKLFLTDVDKTIELIKGVSYAE